MPNENMSTTRRRRERTAPDTFEPTWTPESRVQAGLMNLRRRVGLMLGALALLCVPGGGAAQGERYRWERADTERGVALFTSDVPAHSFEAVKGVVTLPIAAQPLFAALRDFERYPTWYHHSEDVKVLSAPPSHPAIPIERDGQFGQITPGGPWILFFRQQTPRLDDRWAILTCSYRAGADRTLLVEFKALSAYPYKAPQNTVRMGLHGYWMLKPIDPSHTQVTFLLDVDPKTSAPAFLVNPVLRETVLETVLGLARVARRPRPD